MKINKSIVKPILTFLCLASFLLSGTFSPGQENKKINIDWVLGPKEVKIGDIAEITIPKGYNFAHGDDTRKIMEYIGNPPNDMELGYLAPVSNKWYLVFEFNELGYVKDDEKDKLDPDAIFESLQQGNEEGNKWRKENGMPELKLVGWYKKPQYDPLTNNLEWATVAESSGQKVINYNIRYLGRKGVMEIILVDSPENLKSSIKATKMLLQKYDFTGGNRYSEFQEGDKIAEYGLAALVTGGAVAVAAKSGILSKIWKFLVAGFLGIVAFLKRFMGKITGRKSRGQETYVTEQQQQNMADNEDS